MGSFDASDVFELRTQGWTMQQVADELGVSRSTISRVLQAGPPSPQVPGLRLLETRALAESLDTTSAATKARLGLVLTLAAKLDQAEAQSTAASAVAVANLTAQYRATLTELAPQDGGSFERLVAALTGDMDGEAERYRAALTVIAASRSDGSKDAAKPRHTAEEQRAIAVGALGRGT